MPTTATTVWNFLKAMDEVLYGDLKVKWQCTSAAG
jgi:hypothetical protein